MDILSERVSPNLNLRMQGIETREAVTFRDVIIAILDNRTRHPGNPEAKKWADRQSPSIALPLRIAITQHIQLSAGEMQQIREESIDGLMQYKRAQGIKQREKEKKRATGKEIPTDTKVEVKPEEITLTEKEIEDWMSLRVVGALQRKIEAATMELLGNTNLIGFLDEETLEKHIRGLVFQRLQNKNPVPQELETV